MYFNLQEIYDGVPTAPKDGNKRHGGRKMMQFKRLLGMVLVKEEGNINGGDNHVEKNKISGEGILNHHVECSRRNMSPRRLKAKMTDFIAFNADYHVPEPHPPKNN